VSATTKEDEIFTAVSFAPVQGFIEKSRKLRDLFGASLILSYLSQQLAKSAEDAGLKVISPALINVQEGMPNRILIRGKFERNDVEKVLIQSWDDVLTVCRGWIERNVSEQYHWDYEWLKWKQYSWEIFWGTGETTTAAMEDLECRKLKRNWIGVNWTGDSSSLTGTDAIAWHRLGDIDLVKRELKGELKPNEPRELKQELENFYLKLAQALEQGSTESMLQGKFLRPNERLSIPELTKRLVTRYEDIGKHLDKSFKVESFSEMVRMPEPGQPGHWTGWFMGDGDKIGKYIKSLKNEAEISAFSNAMRIWGKDFKKDFCQALGRVVYAGGDDFMGVIYSSDPHKPIPPSTALEWLTKVNNEWARHQQPVSLSVGFIWAGHSIPQRDILQHCREAEKRAKSLGRDRVTIRVVFNSGQYVQWTCPWDYLDILTKYRDREGKQNWSHVYSDWAQLKARHGIELKDTAENADECIALAIFELYFKDLKRFEEHKHEIFKEENDTHQAIIQWIDGLINVGWQLCSNT
jgi:CRISPR-associated protein Cmr2